MPILLAISAEPRRIRNCLQKVLAAQLMATTWLCVVTITNDNALVIRNITFQANKANQIIIFSFIISEVIFFRHINYLIRLQAFTFTKKKAFYPRNHWAEWWKWANDGAQCDQKWSSL